jgi:hypothetical protein
MDNSAATLAESRVSGRPIRRLRLEHAFTPQRKSIYSPLLCVLKATPGTLKQHPHKSPDDGLGEGGFWSLERS